MDALQRIRVLLVPSLATLLHHGGSILLGFEDGELLWWVDLTLRHESGTRLHGHAVHERVRSNGGGRIVGLYLYRENFLMVHGYLAVAGDADL